MSETDGGAVLIIDDDDLVRRAFRRVLSYAGFDVSEAIDGASGLEAVRERNPSVVLLDLRMPGMDGLDVLSRLVESRPEMPVLVVSGEGTMRDVVEALRRGAWDFVSKPVSDSELLVRAVERGLEKAALRRKNREYAESLRLTNQRLSAALAELRADQHAARLLQFQLLPPDEFRLGSLSCARRLFPSQVLSGDFLDYFPIGERFLGFYLADVAGHGAASAFVTAILTTLVGKYRELHQARGDETILHPQHLLTCLDADLVPHRLGKHVTMFYGVLDSSSGRLVYANAGAYPFPFLSNAGKVQELECRGRPLNLPVTGRFGVGETELSPGGCLFIASDGVLEIGAKRSHRERCQSIADVMSRARSMDAVLRGLGLQENTELTDDVALLLVRREESHA